MTGLEHHRPNRPLVRILMRDASLTGVPVSLLRYLRWAARNVDADFDIVTRFGGPLLGRLATAARNIRVLEPKPQGTATTLAAGLALLGAPTASRHVSTGSRVLRQRTLRKPDAVVVHGAGAWHLVGSVVPSGVPLILHLHEGPTGLDRSIPQNKQQRELGKPTTVLAVSPAVRAMAVGRGVPNELIAVVPGCVDAPVSPPPRHAPEALSRNRGEQAGRLVAACGTPGWRKGVDRFVALAWELQRTLPSVRCQWVGGRPEGPDAAFAPSPVQQGTIVEWVPPTATPWATLARAEVLVAPSREDVLPLVLMEAAIRRVPVVATRSGGAEDLLAAGRGWLVNQSLGPAGLLDAVLEVLTEPSAATTSADMLQSHVLSHYITEVVAPRWWSHIRASMR